MRIATAFVLVLLGVAIAIVGAVVFLMALPRPLGIGVALMAAGALLVNFGDRLGE
jgi:lipoprotein signal peptidase